ncbi:hypothetical protein F5Y07DRAFT_355779, partial [Xylaria sp. FL0933]
MGAKSDSEVGTLVVTTLPLLPASALSATAADTVTCSCRDAIVPGIQYPGWIALNNHDLISSRLRLFWATIDLLYASSFRNADSPIPRL